MIDFEVSKRMENGSQPISLNRKDNNFLKAISVKCYIRCKRFHFRQKQQQT